MCNYSQSCFFFFPFCSVLSFPGLINSKLLARNRLDRILAQCLPFLLVTDVEQTIATDPESPEPLSFSPPPDSRKDTYIWLGWQEKLRILQIHSSSQLLVYKLLWALYTLWTCPLCCPAIKKICLLHDFLLFSLLIIRHLQN